MRDKPEASKLFLLLFRSSLCNTSRCEPLNRPTHKWLWHNETDGGFIFYRVTIKNILHL